MTTRHAGPSITINLHQPFLWLLLVGAALILTGCVGANEAMDRPPQAVDGVLDLRAWELATDGPVALNGEWEFYWEQRLSPADFIGSNPPRPGGLMAVPASWQGTKIAGQTLPGTGYATYRLTVLIDPAALPEALLAVKMPVPVISAHKLFVGGEMIGSAGENGESASTTSPSFAPYVAAFAPLGDRVEILIQISNFHHFQGGILEQIRLGSHGQVHLLDEQQAGLDFFIIGSILIMGLYHLGLFAVRRRERALLYFGLFCLFIAGSSLLANHPAVFAYFISPSWALHLRVRMTIAIPAIFCLFLFTRDVTRSEPPRWFVWTLGVGGLSLAGLILLAPILTATQLLPPLALFVGLGGISGLGMALAAALRRRQAAIFIVLGYLPLALAILNDLLFYNGVIQTRQTIHLGLFAFIFVQAALLAARFANTFTKSEEMTAELQSKNRSLHLAQAELLRSEAKYRAIFEDSADVIFLATLDGQIEAVNPACFDLLGYADSEVRGRKIGDFLTDPALAAGLQEAIGQAGALSEFPLQVRHRDGHELVCQLTATLRHDPADNVLGYQGILHDVTAYRQAEAARQRSAVLQQMNRTLEHHLEERTADLSDANEALQEEIAQRQMHQQEKDRLLELAHQQSGHLTMLSTWLAEMQQNPPSHSSTTTDGEIERKIAEIRQNLGLLQNAAILEQDPELLIQIADTIRLLAEMEVYVEQIAAAASAATTGLLADSPLLQLSSRERQVLKLMAEGKSNPEIADLLTVRLNTIHTYLKRIRRKLDIQDLPGLIEFARSTGLID